MHRFLKYLTAFLAALVLGAVSASAQFKEDAFTQQYNDDADTVGRDSTDVMFTFGEYFGGIRHKRDERIGVLFAGSTVFLGGMQAYNRDYWKLPFTYGAIGAGITGGILYRKKWHDDGGDKYKRLSNWFFAGAGLAYWATLMDGIRCYKPDIPHQAGKATLYSMLLPGLGQAYNGEYWKIPIYYGLMIGSVHFYLLNNKNYHRYKRIYKQAGNPDSGYDGPVSAETALYYRDAYRRYRDYSIVAIAGSYLLQVIDANVFSYMTDFELTDDLAMRVSPAVITDEPVYAYNPYQPSSAPSLHYSSAAPTGFGLRVGLTF